MRTPLTLVACSLLAGFALIACKAGEPSSPPFIGAAVACFAPGTAPAGYRSAQVAVGDVTTGAYRADAKVSVNGVSLPYEGSTRSYSGDVVVAPGATVIVRVGLGETEYTVSATQVSPYPTLVAPAPGSTWHTSVPGYAQWDGIPTNLSAVVGVLDAADPNGDLVWPADRQLHWDSTGEHYVIVPSGSLTTGSRLLFAGAAQSGPFPGTDPQSTFILAALAFAPLTVVDSTLVSLAVTPSALTLHKGTAGEVSVLGTFSDGTTQDMTGAVNWTTTDASIASISFTDDNGVRNFGFVTTGAEGMASLTASFGGVSGSTQVTVTPPVVTSLSVGPVPVMSLAKKASFPFQARASFGDGDSGDVTATATWASSDDTVATVSSAPGSTGLVTGMKHGSAVITASLRGMSGSATVNVTDWTAQDAGTPNDLTSVRWAGGQYVAVGGGGTIITSPDGVTWTQRNSGTTAALTDVAWSGAKYVAVGTPAILTSPDARSWTSQASPNNFLDRVAASGSLFVATGGYVVTSPDGVTWTVADQVAGLSVDWTGSEFLATGPAATYTSPDGISWMKVGSPGVGVGSIAWSGSRFVAATTVALSSASSLYTSPDGVTWAPLSAGPEFDAVAWSGAEFRAVGYYGEVATSSDGLTWAISDLGSGKNLFGLASSGSQFVAVGQGGAVFTSP